MITHPTADELLSAVADYIGRIAPQLQDRDAFLARVAVNALATVRRELAEGPAAAVAATGRMQALLNRTGDTEGLNADLCHAIRTGAFDHDEGALLAHLRATTVDQVRIDQPTYSGLKTASA